MKNSETSHSDEPTSSLLKFCPKCADPLELRTIDGKVRQACSSCEFVFYRDPKPVAGVLAFKGKELLLIQRGNEPKYGLWSFPTGFVDIGETPAETAIREAHEEANVEVQIERLLGVYSNDLRSVVLIIYVGTIQSDELRGQSDALDARLFQTNALPELAFAHDYQILADLLEENMGSMDK